MIFGISVFFGACQKDLNDHNIHDDSILTELNFSREELVFLSQLELPAGNAIGTDRSIDPSNSNNDFDHYGEELANSFKELRAIQYTDSAAGNSTEFVQQWLGQLDGANLDPIDSSEFSTLEEATLSFFLAYFTNTEYTLAYLIGRFKDAEDLVASSQLFSNVQKQRILSFSASMKFLKYEIWTNGIVIDGIEYLPGGWWSCWESNFSSLAGSKIYNALWSWDDAPVSTALNWVGLPATLIGSVGDAAWNAGNGC